MNVYFFPNEYRQEIRKCSGVLKLPVIVFILIMLILWPYPVCADNTLQRQYQFPPLLKTKVPTVSVSVKNIYPHDTGAFTQGLFFHQGYLYESTGLNGESTLSRKELTTGKCLQEVTIAKEYFGEGATLLKNKIYQLTWRSETLLIYDAISFRETGKMKYRGEGWGLTSDGRHLLMSDGSSTITYRDPVSFKVIRKIRVYDGEWYVSQLNELEFIKGEIWANVYREDVIARISPRDGKVTGWIDLSVLRSYLPRHAQVDVLNGIAFDEKSDRIFVTGKYWPKVFEIQLSK